MLFAYHFYYKLNPYDYYDFMVVFSFLIIVYFFKLSITENNSSSVFSLTGAS